MTAGNAALQTCIEFGDTRWDDPPRFGPLGAKACQCVVELPIAQERFEVITPLRLASLAQGRVNGGRRHSGSPYFRFTFAILDRTRSECKPRRKQGLGIRDWGLGSRAS